MIPYAFSSVDRLILSSPQWIALRVPCGNFIQGPKECLVPLSLSEIVISGLWPESGSSALVLHLPRSNRLIKTSRDPRCAQQHKDLVGGRPL